MTLSDFTEHQLTTKDVYQGKMLRVKEDQISLPDGTTATREYILHPGAVAIIPMLDDQTLLLERQYRYPMGRHMIELPAGKIDAGEDPLLCGQRELLEETGFIANDWQFALTTHPCISYSNERIEYYLARDLKHIGHAGEEGEFLEVMHVTLAQALGWIASGEITDTKTIVGLYWLERTLRV